MSTFDALRAELDLPGEFPADVTAEAVRVAAEPVSPDGRADRRDIPFVTIDPPGSMDLDQAVHLERSGDGFVVHYAIADVGAAVPPGGAVDLESWRRGETVYLPDGRVPLHPPELSEGALSLLPDQDRRAVLWTVAVGVDGSLGTATVERAVVRSVARLDYEGVQAAFDAGSPHPSVEALADLGRARRAARVAAGALELGLPEQEVEPDGDGWVVHWRRRAEADDWNAEVSLLTGMAAARIMLDASVGVLRVLPPPDRRDVERFLGRARSLGVDVGTGTAAQVLAGLDATRPLDLALMNDGARLLRGAGYVAFDGRVPEESHHAGIGGPYAQVTAPLRRLADRYGTEVCLAVSAGTAVPEWARTALDRLPDAMREADRRASAADRGATDLAEALMLQGRVGETFQATVVRADDERVTVMLDDPSVLAACEGTGLREGAQLAVELITADPTTAKVVFRPV